jgi:hypothetical protein
MEKYTVILRLKATDTHWPYRSRPDREFEFEHGTRIVLIEGPKIYYVDSNKLAKFRLEDGPREYFADWRYFLKQTEIQA